MQTNRGKCFRFLMFAALTLFSFGFAELDTVKADVTAEDSLAALSGKRAKARQTQRLCTGGVFKPCVCWQNVPKSISYRPSDPRCGKSTYPGDTLNNRASIILRRDLFGAFSVVVRDVENADRSPYEPAICTREEFLAGRGKCSRWKLQSTETINGERIICLGASGYSSVFKRIRRMTVKMSDRVTAAGTKDIRRYCLRSPSASLN